MPEKKPKVVDNDTSFRIETNSKIIPYKVFDHAWTNSHEDHTNYKQYRKDAPAGYKEHIKTMKPHPTNLPYMDQATACMQDARIMLRKAKKHKNYKEMKQALKKSK